MKNKKTIMTFSALQILIFHLWINVCNHSVVEMFIKQISYIGVDLFFFISIYSLASSDLKDYKKFVCSRFQKIYIRFVIFALIAFLYNGWSIIKFFKVISFVDFIEKGGGAFLWFLPAILLIYIVFPIFRLYDKKNRPITFFVSIILYLGLAFLLNSYGNQLLILWNRIPIMLIAYYVSVYKISFESINNKIKLLFGLLSIIVGTILAFKFAFTSKLNVPFKDTFYIVIMPLAFGLIVILGFLKTNKIINVIGSSTLEIYGIQMIFGYKLTNKIFMLIKNKLITNIIVIITVVSLSVFIHYLYEFVDEKIKKLPIYYNIKEEGNKEH